MVSTSSVSEILLLIVAISSLYKVTRSEYLGCFPTIQSPIITTVGISKRDLMWADENDESMSLDKCAAHCRSQNYLYAGVVRGTSCVCDNYYGRYGIASPGKCSVSCPGKSSQKCGGNREGDWDYISVKTSGHACSNKPCLNNGVCYPQGAGYKCVCMGMSYSGENCEKVGCAATKCQNGGKCFEIEGEGKCQCKDEGYNATANCQEINDCISNPCQNGGTCYDAHGKHRCYCKSGYTGENCERKINPCNPNPCLNGGICKATSNYKFRCECDKDFEGGICGTKKLPEYKPSCFKFNCTQEEGKSDCVEQKSLSSWDFCAKDDKTKCVIWETVMNGVTTREANCATSCDTSVELDTQNGNSQKTLKCCDLERCNYRVVDYTIVDFSGNSTSSSIASDGGTVDNASGGSGGIGNPESGRQGGNGASQINFSLNLSFMSLILSFILSKL